MGANRVKAPNLVIRRIREVERRETREEFATAVVNAGLQLGERHLGAMPGWSPGGKTGTSSVPDPPTSGL